MEILFTIENGYSQHLGVALSSIIQNNRTSTLTFHVVVAAISASNKRALRSIAAKGKSAIFFYEPPDLSSYGLKIDGHATEANYYRLFATDILPSHIHKIIYLDADLVVLKSLVSLWETSVYHYAVAAVNHENEERSNNLGMGRHEYFNSGVMLINLDFWRNHELVPEFVSFINQHQELIRYWDQDVLNYCLNKKVWYLSNAWNASEFDPSVKILHFMGKHKPWSKHYAWNELKRMYFMYLFMTPYAVRNWKSIIQYLKFRIAS